MLEEVAGLFDDCGNFIGFLTALPVMPLCLAQSLRLPYQTLPFLADALGALVSGLVGQSSGSLLFQQL